MPSKAASLSAVPWCNGCGMNSKSSKAPEKLKHWPRQIDDTAGVYFVPAFAGLGAPYWDPHARGMLIGLSRGAGKAHIARAALESMCFQSMEVLLAMEKDAGLPIDILRVDGGASANNLLMQIQGRPDADSR